MSCSLERRRLWIQPHHPQLSVRRQCALLGLAAASYYYHAVSESAENLFYQRLLDEEYTRHWYSRYVLAWELSISLEADFCVALLERALVSARPEIFNTDQGVQFTSAQFQAPLLAAQVRLSMDGRGRAFDTIFVDRL